MSSSEWKRMPLEDCMDAIIDYRGKTPRKSSFGIPLITAKIVKGGRILEPTEFIPFEDYDDRMQRGIPQAGDVLITTEGPLGEIAQLDDRKVSIGQRLITLRGKKGLLDNAYLKFLMMSEFVQDQLLARATGTTVSGIKQAELRKIDLLIPPLPTQRRIADILSALDEKIELNRQTNATLEAIARAIFKEWFVEFNFPGATGELVESELGTIPSGWRVSTFEKELEAERGLSYKGDGLETGNATPMHNLNSVYEGGGYKLEGIKYYSGEYREKHLVKPGDLIIANTEQGHKYLLIGYPAIVPALFGKVSIYSHHIYLLRPLPHSYLTSDFLYYLLLQPPIREQVVGFANGTTVNMLRIDGLKRPKFILPPKDLISRFTELASNSRIRQEENIKESQTLSALRDLLLPKLINGEIDVWNG